MTWFLATFSAPFDARAEKPPPDYVAPTPVARRLSVAAARIVLTGADHAKVPADERPAFPDAWPLAQKPLTLALQERMDTAVGTGRERLVVRVNLIEARVMSDEPPVVGALLEVVVEHEGRALTATRGSSRLHGHLEGMSPRSAERIEGAIVDAFERSVLRPAFVDATNAALAAEREREPDAPAELTRVDETRDAWQIRDHEGSAAAHVVSAVFDGGDTFSFGARYLHDHFSSGLGLLWGGYGVEARIISDEFTRVDAVAGLAILRAGIGYEQVFSLEFGMGPGRSDEVRAVGIAGAYFTAYYVDLGFTAQFVVSPTPQFRPLTGGHFGVRINVPVDVHGVTVDCHSPLPCRAEGPAFVGNEKGPRRPTELESKD